MRPQDTFSHLVGAALLGLLYHFHPDTATQQFCFATITAVIGHWLGVRQNGNGAH